MRPAWKALAQHHQKIRNLHLRELFANDPQRGERLTAEAAGLYLDYSKNRVTDETIELLLRLGEECGLAARIDAMFTGQKINVTEQRAVLHVALRAPENERILVDGVLSCLRCTRFSTAWRPSPKRSARAAGADTLIDPSATS
jgi:glucose-6-phosphate isomerase